MHGKMQIQRSSLLRLLYPLAVKPVRGRLGIAVEPKLAPADRTARAGLLDEASRLKRHLVEQHSCKGDPLHERGGALVLSSEKMELIFDISRLYRDNVFRYAVGTGKPQLTKRGQNGIHDISPERNDSLAA